MSLSPADWELLHRELDGETTPEESVRLGERLAREADLDSAHQALRGVGRTLSEVDLADPPPDLAGNVMRQVRQRSQPRAEPGWLSGLTGWVVRRPALALASSLAVGLLAGLLATSRSGPGTLPPLDGAAVSGTLLPLGHLASLPVIDEARLEGPGVRATARTRRGKGAVVAELEIAPGRPVDVTVEVEATALSPRGFECLGGEAAGEVVIEPGRVHVRRAPAGRCFVSLAILDEDGGRVSVHVHSETGRAEATLRSRTSAE